MLIRKLFENAFLRSVLVFVGGLNVILLIVYCIRHITPTLNERAIFHGVDNDSTLANNSKTGGNYAWNAARLRRSKAYLDEFNRKNRKVMLPDPARRRIAVIAADRPNESLTQVVGHLVHFYPPTDYELVICNAGRSGTKRSGEIAQFAERFRVVDLADVPAVSQRATEGRSHYDLVLMKEAEDYWRCLTANWNGTDYLLVLEDDAVPLPSFPIAVGSLVEQLDRWEKVDYVKLYHPWSLRGIPSYFQMSAVCLSMAWLLYQCVCQRRSGGDWLACLAAGTAAAVITIRYYPSLAADVRMALTGSVYLAAPTESCCTQAVLFRARRMPEMLADFARERVDRRRAKDHVLDESRFVGRATDANFVIHVGYFSVLRGHTVHLDLA